MPWRDCPAEYGSWHMIYTRFKRWSENGLFWKILNELKQRKLIEFDIIFMDSTTVKLHRHGLGALKKMGKQCISKNVEGKGAKFSIIVVKQGVIQVCITGAHGSKPVEKMLLSLNLLEARLSWLIRRMIPIKLDGF